MKGIRWGVQRAPHPCAVDVVHEFASEAARDAWVAESPLTRRAVGVRHKAVRQYRDDQEALLRARGQS